MAIVTVDPPFWFWHQVLANCSNLMIWSDDDICSGLVDRDAMLSETEGAKGTPLALATTIRLCQQVYREYQRQLFHPDGWHMQGMEQVCFNPSVLCNSGLCGWCDW